MAKLPKHLIKKYGISKRAWAEFRKSKRSTTTKRRTSTMAKKTYKKSYKKRKSSSAKMQQITKIVAGASIVGLYEVFISPRIPLQRNIKNMLELLIGAILLSQRNTYMKSAGIALIAINTFEIVVPLIRNIGGGKALAVNNGGVDAYLN